MPGGAGPDWQQTQHVARLTPRGRQALPGHMAALHTYKHVCWGANDTTEEIEERDGGKVKVKGSRCSGQKGHWGRECGQKENGGSTDEEVHGLEPGSALLPFPLQNKDSSPQKGELAGRQGSSAGVAAGGAMEKSQTHTACHLRAQMPHGPFYLQPRAQ